MTIVIELRNWSDKQAKFKNGVATGNCIPYFQAAASTTRNKREYWSSNKNR